MTKASRQTGYNGEMLAQRILARKGFRMEALNWRAGKLGEIDLVAYHPEQGLLVFVEVKARRSGQYGAPQEAVHPRKQAQIAAMAEAYLAQHPTGNQVQIRFDVIGILYPGGGKPIQIEHIEDAFRLF